MNFKSISSGAPIGNLPVDPTNNSSSRLYYSYATNGTTYEVTTAIESQKYKVGGSNDVITGDGGSLASVYEKGTKLGLEPMDYGDSSLVGYWSFEEGSSSIAYDYSGNNATGSWNGSGTHYATGKIGTYTGQFATTTSDYVSFGSISISEPLTISFWADPFASAGLQYPVGTGGVNNAQVYLSGSSWNMDHSGVGGSAAAIGATLNQWQYVTAVFAGPSNRLLYINGQLVATNVLNTSASTTVSSIGRSSNNIGGYLDDVRIYNRALSATEIAALYNGGK